MIDNHYIQWMIEDILLSKQYTLAGIAYYTHTPEEVVYEILIGSHSRPSALFLERIITLHRESKHDLYDAIKKKVAEEFCSKYEARAKE